MATTQQRQAARSTQRGITLVELAVVLALIAIIVGIALPSYAAAIERQRLRGVADELEFDTRWARGAAQAAGRPLRLTVQSNAAATCYVVHSGDRDDCDCLSGAGTTSCQGGAQAFKTVYLPSSAPIHLKTNNRSMQFEPRRGVVTPTASIEVVTRHGDSIRKIVAITGRVRSCSPSGSVSGVPAC
jgi:type IV fimbrial biogenesis protein FimT